jgi:hypothetical protein
VTTRRSKAVRFLVSPKLTAVLMLLLISMVVLAVIVPQPNYMPVSQMQQFRSDWPVVAAVADALRLDSIFGSWLMASVTLLLIANVGTCTFVRLRRVRHVPQVRRLPDMRDAEATSSPEERLDAAQGLLASGKWRVESRTAHGLLARRGHSGFWGSMALHAGILVVCIGGALTVLTQFRGTMIIAEGQTVTDSASAYRAVLYRPRIRPAYNNVRLTLEGMDFVYSGNDVIRATARVAAIDPAGQTSMHDVMANYPLEAGGKYYLLQTAGYAADVRLVGPNTAQRLTVTLADKTDFGFRDRLDLSSLDPSLSGAVLRLYGTATPLGIGDRPPARLYELSQPRLRVATGTAEVAGTLLAPGDAVDLGNGWSLVFDRMSYWAEFLVRGDDARWIVFTGFWLCVAGAAWRFGVPERRIVVIVQSAGTTGAGSVQVGYRMRPWQGSVLPADAELLEALVHLREQDDA